MSAPQVSVLIVSYNVKQFLDQTILSIRRSDFSGNIETVVVDNNSFDGTPEFIRDQYPDIKLITNDENRGFGKAVNQAAAAARGDYLLILNPDTVLQENTIHTLQRYLDRNPRVGLAGPKILNADGTLQAACKRSFPTLKVAAPKILGLNKIFPRARWANKYNLSYLDPDTTHAVDAVSGSCMFLSTALYQSLGGFDERFFMFGEDLDICYRVRQNGLQVVYLAETQIIHYQGESVKTAPFDSINAFYNAMVLFADKHFSAGYGVLVRVVIRLGIGVRKLLALLGSRRSQMISIALDAMAVAAAFLLAIPLKFPDYEPLVVSRGLIPGIYIFFWIIVAGLFQLYSRYLLSYSRAILAALTGFLAAVAFTYFFKQYAFSRLVILVASLLIAFLLPGWRILINFLIARGWFRPVNNKHSLLFARRALIVGTDNEGRRIANRLRQRFDTGLELVGFSDSRGESVDSLPLPFVGSLTDIRAVITKNKINELIFSSGRLTNKKILNVMEETRDLNLTYRMVPREQDILLGKAAVEEIGEFSFINVEYSVFRRFHQLSKRLFDLTASLVIMVLTSPLLVIYSLTGKMRSEQFWGPDGSQFRGRIIDSDNRFVGKLPLLWQVLRGRMSLVGAALTPGDEPNPQLIYSPGITGLHYLRKIQYSPDERRLLEHYYVQHQTFTLDLEILLKSFVGN